MGVAGAAVSVAVTVTTVAVLYITQKTPYPYIKHCTICPSWLVSILFTRLSLPTYRSTHFVFKHSLPKWIESVRMSVSLPDWWTPGSQQCRPSGWRWEVREQHEQSPLPSQSREELQSPESGSIYAFIWQISSKACASWLRAFIDVLTVAVTLIWYEVCKSKLCASTRSPVNSFRVNVFCPVGASCCMLYTTRPLLLKSWSTAFRVVITSPTFVVCKGT